MANLSNINGKFVVEQTTGYVGVGTTDPNYPIEVLNASAEIALNASGGSIYRVQSDSASNFIIRKEGVGDRLVINSAGNATFAGGITMSNSILISYTGSDGMNRDAGLKIINDANDWGILVDKGNAAGNNFGVRINTDGANAFSIYNSAGTNKVNFTGAGVATFAGNVTLTDGKMQISGPALTDNYLKINVANVPLQNGILINYAGASQSTGLFINQPNGGGSGAADYALLKVNNQGANPTFYSSNNGASPVIIKANGNVGIGEDSPDFLVDAKKGYSSGDGKVAKFRAGNDATFVQFDTVQVVQSDVPCLSIIETSTGTQADEQKLTFNVGDARAIIGSSTTVTDGMSFYVNRAVTAHGYSQTGTKALHLQNNGNSIFGGDVKIAEATNKGQLFFGTANTDYEIKGGGNYGYLSLVAPILRFDTNGSERN